MDKLKFLLAAAILLALWGCVENQPPVTKVDFELVSLMKDNSTYKAVVFIKSIEPNRTIPVSAFAVKTRNKVFLLDSENVWAPGSRKTGSIEPSIKPGNIFVINLSEDDRYFWIHPVHHDYRVLGYLLVAISNLTDKAEKELAELSTPLKPPVFPSHSVAYKNGRLFLLDNTIFGEAGSVIDNFKEFKEDKIAEIGNLSLRKGYTLKRIVLGVTGADVHGIVIAVYNDSGFWIEPMNDKQGAFLFAPIENGNEALDYLRFLIHETEFSVAGRHYEEITSKEMFEETVEMINEHCKEKGAEMKVIRNPPVDFTRIKTENNGFIVERVYFTRFPEKIVYLKAFVYKNGEVNILEKYDCVVGVYYAML